MPVSFTFDLEDDGSSNLSAPRYERATARVLALLAERGVRATFFVVGEVAERSPRLVADIAGAGHEVGLHGYRHVAVTKLGKRAFAEDLRCGKAVLEDLVGIRLRGYRAPMFSLTAATPWAPAHLLEAGFAYSSSVLPAASPLHGLPGAPRGPFRWAGELLELPCPLAGWGRLSIPVLGGVYLRYLPRAVVRLAARRARHAATAWTYLHPYDFDAGAPYVRLPHAGELVSRILHHRRADTSRRVVEVLELAGAGPPLCELAQRLRDERLPVFAP